MKKKLGLIHTVNWYEKSVIEPFASEFCRENPDVELINIMDDSLLSESLAHGGPTPAVLRRMVLYAMAAESAGADVVMITCTTVGEGSRIARRFLSVPIFNIDEPMAKEAVRSGGTLGVLATVPTSAPATRALLELEAQRLIKSVRIETVVNEPAFRSLLAGDIETHDGIVREEIDRLAQRVDVVVLGQISLSRIRHTACVPVLQVGRSGFAEARRLLEGVRGGKLVESAGGGV
jgi:aspartate/glutamate racemase